MMTLLAPLMLAAFIMSVQGLSLQKSKVLVLGGTGFLGRRVIEEIVTANPNVEVTSISRRGKLEGELNDKVNWIAGDVNVVIEDVIKKFGPFNSCVHTIGLLLDNQSGLSQFNRYASGSGSVPDDKSTYDYVTRQSATNALYHLKRSFQRSQPSRVRNASLDSNKFPFVFISAAEASWTFRPPVEWLDRYLEAKRSVESEMLNQEQSSWLRPVVIRPSLLWTTERLQALPSVLPFYVANFLKVPFVDRPVLVETLVKAINVAITDDSVKGTLKYPDIDRLASYAPKK